MDKIRFGMIGLGNMGSSHSKNFAKNLIPEGIVTALADLDGARAAKIREQYAPDAACFDSAHALIHSGLVDAVIVAVPHYFHPEYVMEGLRAGLHVMSEKPAGVYTKAVREMNECAAQSDKLFGIMFQNRTNPVNAKMHEIVASGALGRLKRTSMIVTDWYRSQSYYDSGTWRATWRGEGGGVLLNQCPHSLDLWQWIVGELPKTVRAFCHNGKWHNIEVEDDVTAYVEYPSGATGTFVTTTADTPGTNRFEVIGDLGKIVAEGDVLSLYRNKQGEREFNATYTGGFGEPGFEKEIIPTPGDFPEHSGVLRNFCAAIRGRERLMIPGEEGIRGLTLSNAMHLSSWLDKTVELPLDEDLFLEELKKRAAASAYKEGKNVVLDTEGSY